MSGKEKRALTQIKGGKEKKNSDDKNNDDNKQLMKIMQATVNLNDVRVFYAIDDRVKEFCKLESLSIVNVLPSKPHMYHDWELDTDTKLFAKNLELFTNLVIIGQTYKEKLIIRVILGHVG